MAHEEFFSWTEREWHWDGDLIILLKNFTEKLLSWNKNTFCNILKRKKELQGSLTGVSREIERRLMVGLLKQERRSKKEYADVLLQEEMLWMQKLRIDWLRLRDRKTRFFHTSTLVRRRRNKIVMLRGEDGG